MSIHGLQNAPTLIF